MATKDISDKQVCEAVRDMRDSWNALDILEKRTGQPYKVCVRAVERACDRGLLDWGVSIRVPFLLEAGKTLVGKLDKQPITLPAQASE